MPSNELEGVGQSIPKNKSIKDMNAPFPFLCCCFSQRNTKQLQRSYYKRNTTKVTSPWAKFFSDVVKKLRGNLSQRSPISGSMQGYRTGTFQNFAVLRRQVKDESRRWERMEDGITWSNVVSQHSCLQFGAYPPLNFSFHVSPALNVLSCMVRDI